MHRMRTTGVGTATDAGAIHRNHDRRGRQQTAGFILTTNNRQLAASRKHYMKIEYFNLARRRYPPANSITPNHNAPYDCLPAGLYNSLYILVRLPSSNLVLGPWSWIPFAPLSASFEPGLAADSDIIRKIPSFLSYPQ